jgi:hypothetical protein
VFGNGEYSSWSVMATTKCVDGCFCFVCLFVAEKVSADEWGARLVSIVKASFVSACAVDWFVRDDQVRPTCGLHPSSWCTSGAVGSRGLVEQDGIV